MRIVKLFLINLVILLIFVEIISFSLLKLNIFPDGLPPSITLNAHQKYSYWHPKNQFFKIASKCWKSEVYFNNIGMKQKKIFIKKNKPRIAIIGDSMTENLQLSNNIDFTSKLQKLLPNYEILNFSVSSTGLADQINIYDNLVKNYEPDYLFLYVTENDFLDNSIFDQRPNRVTYKVLKDQVHKVDQNYKFFDEYFSKKNIFTREKLIHIKKISNFYKIFWYLKYEILAKDEIKKKKELQIDFKDNKLIFNKILNVANDKIFKHVNTFIFLNVNNHEDMKYSNIRLEMISSLNKYNNFFDTQNSAIDYLKKNNKFKFPYLGFECDGHYSELGVKFLSEFTLKKFRENTN